MNHRSMKEKHASQMKCGRAGSPRAQTPRTVGRWLALLGAAAGTTIGIGCSNDESAEGTQPVTPGEATTSSVSSSSPTGSPESMGSTPEPSAALPASSPALTDSNSVPTIVGGPSGTASDEGPSPVGSTGQSGSAGGAGGDGAGGSQSNAAGGQGGASPDPASGGDGNAAANEDAGSSAQGNADQVMSSGCGQTPTLSDSPSANAANYNTVSSGGAERRYILRLPQNYDNTHPYRLILGLHGATNNATNVSGNPAFFGLYDLAEDSTIFVAPEAVGGLWSADTDVTFVDDLLQQLESELCIDTSRVIIQGFSQGAAMSRFIVCARPGIFRAAIAHSAGGVAVPSECEPIPYLGSLGTQESNGGGQAGQTDLLAETAGCTIETLPTAPSGGHVCTDYAGCMEGVPVRWCSFDNGHTPLPNDAGQGSSWMPEEVWSFVSQL